MSNIISTLPIFIISIYLSAQSTADSDIARKLASTETSTNRSVLIDFQTRNCSSTITISSYGRSRKVQGSVLGTYLLEDETIGKWPTWKMNNRRDRFLYKCPCGKKWLFGKSNGASEGWIKHPNCTDCPENCSRKWQYWNDNDKKWYFDIKISIRTGEADDNSGLEVWTDIQNLPSWIIITPAVLIFTISTLSGVILYHYSCCKKTVPLWVIVLLAVYSLSIFMFVCITITYAYHSGHIGDNNFWAYFMFALIASWIVTFYGVVPCCRYACQADSLCRQACNSDEVCSDVVDAECVVACVVCVVCAAVCPLVVSLWSDSQGHGRVSGWSGGGGGGGGWGGGEGGGGDGGGGGGGGGGDGGGC